MFSSRIMGLGALLGFLNVVPICGVNFCLNDGLEAGGCDVVTCMGCVVLGAAVVGVDPATVAVTVADAAVDVTVDVVVDVGVDMVVFFDPRVARFRWHVGQLAFGTCS